MIEFGAYREPQLTTARLVLEPLTAWHGESLYPLLKDPLLYTYIPREPPLATAPLSRRFEGLESRRSPDGRELWLNWAVRIASGGYAGTLEATARADGTADLAWIVATAEQRKGYAREGAAAMLGHLQEIGVTEATVFIDTRNAASAKLAEGLDFTRHATHERREKVKGRWVDDHEYRKALTPKAPAR